MKAAAWRDGCARYRSGHLASRRRGAALSRRSLGTIHPGAGPVSVTQN